MTRSQEELPRRKSGRLQTCATAAFHSVSRSCQEHPPQARHGRYTFWAPTPAASTWNGSLPQYRVSSAGRCGRCWSTTSRHRSGPASARTNTSRAGWTACSGRQPGARRGRRSRAQTDHPGTGWRVIFSDRSVLGDAKPASRTVWTRPGSTRHRPLVSTTPTRSPRRWVYLPAPSRSYLPVSAASSAWQLKGISTDSDRRSRKPRRSSL